MIPVKGVKNLTSANTHGCANAPNAHALSFRKSGDTGNVRSMFSKDSGLNPERKLLPGSTVVVEIEATAVTCQAGSRVHARRALFVK